VFDGSTVADHFDCSVRRYLTLGHKPAESLLSKAAPGFAA